MHPSLIPHSSLTHHSHTSFPSGHAMNSSASTSTSTNTSTSPGSSAVPSSVRACLACRSTGRRLVRAGKSALFAHKQRCLAITATASVSATATATASSTGVPHPTFPPVPRREVPCDVCVGLGVVTTTGCVSASERESEGVATAGRICVVGGGIGGLAFALAGLHRGLDVTVYEKDDSFDTRSQGYALTMQQGFTQLRKLGFSMDKLRDIGTTSTGHVTLDKDGEIIGRTGRDRWGSADKDVKRFNIQLPRQSLRHELLSSLPGDMVQWGKKLLSIAPDSKTISFTDGTTTNYDLLVDASGIWSQFVAHHPLSYLGVIVILGRGRVVTKNDLMLGVDKIWQTVDGVTRMYAMPFGIEGETMWQLSWKCSEEMAKELGSDSTRLLSAAKSRVKGWHDPWTELLNSTSLDDVTGYPAYDRWPIPTFDDLPPLVAVLGDAAHPLSPFKGQGANQALADGVELATLLYTRGSGIEAGVSSVSRCGMNDQGKTPTLKRRGDSLASPDFDNQSIIGAFHRQMIERVAVKVQQSREATDVLHSDRVLVRGDHTRGKLRECTDPLG